MKNYVAKLADSLTVWCGSIVAIKLAILSILSFLFFGVLCGFTEGYQIVGNTFMSAVSYIMLFMIQHTQNEDTKLLHKKVDAIMKQTTAKESHDGRSCYLQNLDDDNNAKSPS